MLGAAGPIPDRAQAEARAAVCAGCPKNDPGDWLAYFTVPAARAIRGALNAFREQQLVTALDDRLHLCSACDCPLRLKVWARLSHILAHIPPESKAALHPGCWILAEEKAGGAFQSQ